MTAAFLGWWRTRTVREQRLLLAMFALLAVTILWLGIYRPLQAGLSAARARHAEAVIALGETRARAAALGVLRKGSAAPRGALLPLVQQSASEAGFAAATIASQGERRVSVSIPSARPAAAFGWIAALEARGVVVERLSAKANSDPTLTLDMTLAAGD